MNSKLIAEKIKVLTGKYAASALICMGVFGGIVGTIIITLFTFMLLALLFIEKSDKRRKAQVLAGISLGMVISILGWSHFL